MKSSKSGINDLSGNLYAASMKETANGLVGWSNLLLLLFLVYQLFSHDSASLFSLKSFLVILGCEIIFAIVVRLANMIYAALLLPIDMVLLFKEKIRANQNINSTALVLFGLAVCVSSWYFAKYSISYLYQPPENPIVSTADRNNTPQSSSDFRGEDVSRKQSPYSSQQPELSDYYTIKSMKHLGSLHSNHMYIDPAVDPRLKGGFVQTVLLVREDYFLIIRNPVNGKMFFFDPRSDIDKNIVDLEYTSRKSDSIVHKSWLVATGELQSNDLITGTEGRKWMSVGIQVSRKYSPFSIDNWFVLPGAEKDPISGMEVITLLVFNEQRLDFFFNQQGTEFAPVVNNDLGMPLEEIKYRKVNEQGGEKIIWNDIQNYLRTEVEE